MKNNCDTVTVIGQKDGGDMKNNCDTVTVIADSISKLFNFLKSKELQRPWLCLQSQERCNFLQNYPLKSLKKHA